MTIEQAVAEYNDPMNRGIYQGWKAMSREAYLLLKDDPNWETDINTTREPEYYARPVVPDTRSRLERALKDSP